MEGDVARHNYDVVIIGGAIMGSALAWFLTDIDEFDGSVLVVERDPSYSACSTTHTNSCIRQQFSTELNISISQFGAAFYKDLRARMGGDPRVPETAIDNFGYMYLANTPVLAESLRSNAALQVATGAGTLVMSRDEIAADYPFYALDDILLGTHNTRDEGYFDGATMFDWWKRQSLERGVDYVAGEVVGLSCDRSERRVEQVTMANGARIGCGQVVNAAGPRAARVAAMAGLDLPVEPRKRHTYVFSAQTPLDRPLPLTVDPSGVHVRENGGGTYMAGAHSTIDPGVEPDDFERDPDLWMDKVWPALAARIPAFEAIRVRSEWVGHYAYNTLDQNAVVGPHPKIENFHFLNGFSGHGLQQSPAMGRGLAEWLTHGAYRTLDLTPFHYARIAARTPILERAVI